MPFVVPKTAGEVEAAAAAYGVAPGGRVMMRREATYAAEAAQSGVYITWRTQRAAPGGDECARIGSSSRCFCGHALSEHADVSRWDPRAPPCGACGCRRFEYVPSRPEEVGMWWLPRRQGFDVRAWRAPCACKHGHDAHDPQTRRCRSCACVLFRSQYACLGCDGAQEEHETYFELRTERAAAGRPVDSAFTPLAGCSTALQQAVLGSGRAGEGRRGNAFGSGGGTSSAGAPAAKAGSPGTFGTSCPPRTEVQFGAHSLEDMFESGAMSAAEYHRLLLARTAAAAPTAIPSAATPHAATLPASIPHAARASSRSSTDIPRPSHPGIYSADLELAAAGMPRTGHAGAFPPSDIGVLAARAGPSAPGAAVGQPRPTVRQARVRCAGGSEICIATNIGPPVPVPGHDWSRPWRAQGAPETTAARLGARVGEAAEMPMRRAVLTSAAGGIRQPRRPGGGGGGGGGGDADR